VLAAARDIVRQGDLTEAAIAGLRGFLDEASLTELLPIASIYVGLARFLAVARIEVEEDYLAELREYPLPGHGR
jgi:hypothetical protein